MCELVNSVWQTCLCVTSMNSSNNLMSYCKGGSYFTERLNTLPQFTQIISKWQNQDIKQNRIIPEKAIPTLLCCFDLLTSKTVNRYIQSQSRQSSSFPHEALLDDCPSQLLLGTCLGVSRDDIYVCILFTAAWPHLLLVKNISLEQLFLWTDLILYVIKRMVLEFLYLGADTSIAFPTILLMNLRIQPTSLFHN